MQDIINAIQDEITRLNELIFLLDDTRQQDYYADKIFKLHEILKQVKDIGL